jgi:phage recombination protein Bet
MSNLITTQINQLAERFELPQSEELYNVLKATAFKGEVTDAQLSALLIVSKQYGLNPWTKEIYAFPDKGGIVPVVGVDGWSRIINSNSAFDGMDFDQDADSCTCTIYRKDRSHPIKLTEWMAECKRPGVKPWESHPYRMLRHKAMIQCARIAFGFGGIYDLDEAERIVDAPKDMGMASEVKPPAPPPSKPALPAHTAESMAEAMPRWRKVIESGRKTHDQVLATVRTIATLSKEQEAEIRAIKAPAAPVTEPKHGATDAQAKPVAIPVQSADEFDAGLGQ